MKQQKFECAKSALYSGDSKMKQSERRQTEYVDHGGREVVRTEIYFNIISLLCNLMCFVHLKTLFRQVTDYFKVSISFTRRCPQHRKG